MAIIVRADKSDHANAVLNALGIRKGKEPNDERLSDDVEYGIWWAAFRSYRHLDRGSTGQICIFE